MSLPSTMTNTLSTEELRLIDAYWRAANYLSVGQIYLLDNPLLREPLQPEHVKPRLLGHWGTTPGLNLIYAHLNRAIRARDLRRDLHRRPGHGGPGARRERVPRRHVQRDLSARRPGRRTACASSSGSSRFPAASRATSRPRRRARSTRAASSATRSRTRSAPRSTTPTCSSPASSATARPRPGRSRRAGTRTSSSNPRTRRRRAADPAPQRLQDREPDRARAHPARTSSSRCSRATATSPIVVAGDEPRASAPALAAALDEALDEIARDPARRARRDGVTDRPQLADDRPAHAEGLDRPEGGRRPAGRGHVALTPGAAHRRARQPRAPAPARGVAAQLPARGALRRRAAASRRSSPRSRPTASGA